MAVIQARMSSSRLPGKVLMPLGGRPVLSWVIRAATESRTVQAVVVATSTDPSDDPVVEHAEAAGARVVRGPLEDVLSRFLLVMDLFEPGVIVRLTADCPLLDPALIDAAVFAFDDQELDYLSTTLHRSLPRGLDVEVVSTAALRRTGSEAVGADRSHVTSHIHSNPNQFRVGGISFTPSGDEFRLTLDTPDDYTALEAVVAILGDRPPSWAELIRILRSTPAIPAINAHIRQKAIELG